ncbi:PilZ domain-containing protein [Novosphingobium sp.]|uniref:PilZ domain-containing protein n=1 Tax=Novosphingobium sp. TaxID=1874826 RepID=UPI00286E39B2|nr:PilZ domain-containing protein [Novosphingobium sp.]
MQGQRKANRLYLGVPAALSLPHQQMRCVLGDISAIGAHLKVDGSVAKGATARLDFHELHLFGTVVWVRGNECGVRFYTPVDPEDMQGMLWITQNRDAYEKLTRNAHASEWSQGIWE